MYDSIAVWFISERRKRVAFALLLLVLTLIFLSQALFPPADRVLGEGYDMRGYYYLWHDAAHRAIRQGELPTWDPYLFSGYPFLANPQVDFFYPPAWLTVALPVQVGISWYAIFHIWIAGVGMFLFVRYMHGSFLGATLAGLTFAFSAFFTARIWAGHLVPLATHVWLPLMLLGLVWSARRLDVWSAVIAAVPFALAILAGHTTSLLYVGLSWGLFLVYLLIIEQKRLLLLRQAVIIAVLALALSAVQSVALLEFVTLSTRIAEPSYEFVTSYSLPWAHLITLLIPDYFGEPARIGYWSVPSFVELTIYSGVLPLLGLFLALRKPTRIAWFYVVVIGIGLMLAVGEYGFLYRLFYDLLPPFRLGRAPGRASFLYVFAASALLGEAVSIWERSSNDEIAARLARSMRWALVVAGVTGVAALAATGAVFAALHPTETSGRLWHQIGGWSLATTVFLAGGALLWAYLSAGPTAKWQRAAFAVALTLLVITDLWAFGSRMVVLAPTTPEPLWLDAKQIIGETEQRILPWGISLFWQNGPYQIGLRSVFGYNSMETEAYELFASSIPDPRATTFDLWGAEFVVSAVPLDDYVEGDRPLTLIERTDHVWVYRRGRVLPIARLAYQTETIEGLPETINRIHQLDFNPVTTVILSEDPNCALEQRPETSGTAEIVTHEANTWKIHTNSTVPALLVLSESAYPGWRVTIDGQPAEPLVAYATIRAVCVPSGEHQVTWQFVPVVYWWGGGITLISLLLVAVAIWNIRQHRRADSRVGGDLGAEPG